MGYVTFLLKQPSQARLGGIVDRMVGRLHRRGGLRGGFMGLGLEDEANLNVSSAIGSRCLLVVCHSDGDRGVRMPLWGYDLYSHAWHYYVYVDHPASVMMAD